jgi:signal transduction histidine kinase
MVRTEPTDLDAFADLLIARTRTILWLCLFAGLAFTAVELVATPHLAAPFVVKCIGVSSIITALVLVRGPRAVRHALAVSLAVVGAAYLLTAISGMVSPSREYATTAVLFVAAALTTATLLPWGLGPQSATVLGAVALLGIAVFRAGGDVRVFSDDPAVGDPIVAVFIGLVLSLVTAYEMQRHRLLSMRELAARQRAEHELRVLNAYLEQRVAERTCELQDANARLQALSARLEAIREEERAHMAREVHDGLGQLLTALKIDLDLLPRRIAAVAGSDAARSLQQKLQMMSQLALAMIRSVRRIAAELRPSMLDDLGLAAAIRWQLREFEADCGVHGTFTCESEAAALEPACATALFRIAEEALSNVAHHARATSVAIALGTQADHTVLEVHDDGRGISDADLRKPSSLGLLAMRERARLLGGTVDIHGAPGGGTTVRVCIPQRCSAEPSISASI